MKKNYLMLVVAATLSSLTVSTSYASSLYAGFSAGAQDLSYDMSLVETHSVAPIIPTSYEDSFSANGGIGEIYLGVKSQPIPNKMSLALELGLTGLLAETEEHYNDDIIGSTTIDAQWKYNIGLSLVPGIMLNDKTTLFTRVGFGYGEFSSESSGELSESANATKVPGYIGKFSDHQFTYRLGAGFERAINPQLSLRLEYDYWHFNNVEPDDFTNQTGFVDSYTYKPESNSIMLGLTYHFFQSGGPEQVL